MRIVLSEESIEIHLSRWQKMLGLMRDIRVARRDISNVCVVQDPVHEAMSTGMKVGLRLPWLYFVARTLKLDQAFIVSRRMPALSFAVAGEGPLRRVLVSTPEAQALAERLSR
jgi:hypothetical protein